MTDLIYSPESGVNPYHMTEHYLRKVLVGDIASVRVRLVSALERLGYDILDDEEHIIRGRRQARGWGASYSSADVLDYPMTLIVKLKQQGDLATRATFDYVVKHPSLSKGEKEILTREAEAISALATVRMADKICGACGTESTDDSRFCRRCGTKMDVERSELEILRMSAEVRAGHTSVVSAFVTSTVATVFVGGAYIAMLVGGFVPAKGIGILFIVGLMVAIIGNICAGFGWNRMNRALRRKPAEIAPETAPGEILSFPARVEGPPSKLPPGSVTERTTNLLSDNAQGPLTTGDFTSEEAEFVKR